LPPAFVTIKNRDEFDTGILQMLANTFFLLRPSLTGQLLPMLAHLGSDLLSQIARRPPTNVFIPNRSSHLPRIETDLRTLWITLHEG